MLHYITSHLVMSLNCAKSRCLFTAALRGVNSCQQSLAACIWKPVRFYRLTVGGGVKGFKGGGPPVIRGRCHCFLSSRGRFFFTYKMLIFIKQKFTIKMWPFLWILKSPSVTSFSLHFKNTCRKSLIKFHRWFLVDFVVSYFRHLTVTLPVCKKR